MNVNRISPQAFSRRSEARVLALSPHADFHERRAHHERQPHSHMSPRADARGRRNRVMSISRISPQAFSRRSGTRVLKSGRVPAQSHARTFSESVRIMSADHAPARTLAEGGNAL